MKAQVATLANDSSLCCFGAFTLVWGKGGIRLGIRESRVEGLGLRVEALVVRVEVEGLGLRAEGLGFL